MINLKNYIIESIFDIEDNIDNIDESIKDQIKRFLKDNFRGASSCTISKKPNKDGKFEVSSKGSVEANNTHITSLTNGMFIWTNIIGDFYCDYCYLLTSLEGAPKEVGGSFNCGYCNSLTSLKGTPEKVGGSFSCNNCNSLTSLKGAPKEVGGVFSCSNCNSLTSLEGAPKKVGRYFNCNYCDSLKSLEGAPKEVSGDFYCIKQERYFTQKNVEKVSNVKGKIHIY